MSPSEKYGNQTRCKRKQLDSKKNYKKMKQNMKILKPEEIEEIREHAEESGFFKMQVEDLLKEVNSDKKVELEEWIQDLTSFLKNISASTENAIEDFPLNIKNPYFKTRILNKGVFIFCPPERILKIGSFILDTSINTPIDIAVEIPKACWQNMDFLNERYHRKRALYLAYIAQSLQEAEFIQEIKFVYADDCYLKPNVLITPKGIENATICLSAFPAENAFKLTRFVPTRNNVRSSWLLDQPDDELEVPTPYYNATVLADLLLPKLNDFLKENIEAENIKNAIKLLKMWLIRRGLTSGYGRLNGFIITMYVAYLIKRQKINAIMNPYQIFRCTLFALQGENFEEGISLVDVADNNPPLDDFQKLFPGVFLDESGFMNLLYSVNKETLSMVKHEAKIGLRILDSEMPHSFTLLVAQDISSLEKFEYLIHLKGPKKFKRYSKKLNKIQDYLDFGENKIRAVVPKICDILRKGLNKRILLLDVIKSSPSPWSVYDAPPNPNCGLVTIGVQLNPDVPLSNIEKGPLADDPEAREFRKFWGDQSEWRRFQDGTTRETVFWKADTFEDKRKVFCQIVKDILKRHLNGKDEDFCVNGADVDPVLHLPKQVLGADFSSYGTGEEAHISLMESFNSLSKQLRKLQDLPLQISSIQGISPAFHFSEVFPPLSVSHCSNPSCNNSNSFLKLKRPISSIPPFTPALNVVIEFEGSGKWPDSVEAIKRVKAAFHTKIAQLVTEQCSLMAVPFLNHTDIVKEGFVFRLLIASHKELYLMKTKTLPNGMTKVQDTEESRQLELTTKVYPKLNSLLHGLHQQHCTFGTACRLAKRWVSSQLKHDYIHSTAIELIVAHAYVHPEPYSCPTTPQAGFIRFLSLIANHNWKVSPLIVNLNDELQPEELKEIYSAFIPQRSTLPPMVIVTPLDKRGTLWTKNKPLSLILKRIVLLAEASLESLRNGLFSMKDFDVKSIFRPPLDSFDLIIHLNRDMISKLKYAVDVMETDPLQSLKAHKEYDPKVYPLVEFDPVQTYLEELKANFDNFAFFFYDVFGGDFIGVVWKKVAFAPKEFKTSHVNCHFLEGDSLVGNIESIIEDFKFLGKGIVRCIKRQKHF